MYDPDWVIHTRSEQLSPGVHRCAGSSRRQPLVRWLSSSLLVGLFDHRPGAVVEAGAEVSDWIMMNNTWIGEGAVIERRSWTKRDHRRGWSWRRQHAQPRARTPKHRHHLGRQRRPGSARHQNRSQRGHPAARYRCRVPAGVRRQRGYALGGSEAGSSPRRRRTQRAEWPEKPGILHREGAKDAKG